MKKIITIITLAFIMLPMHAGKVITDSIKSQVLNATVKYNVYLPDGFDRSGKKYPTVYLLHGLYGTYSDWQEMGNMQLVADELIGSGEADEMIIIMPNAGGPDIRKIWNGYFNMPGWSYEDFFFQELIPQAEAKYRGIGDKSHRAIMGLSMGGGGSASYAQRHTDVFSSCYIMSGWLDQEGERLNGKEEKDNKFYYTCKAVHENSCIDFVKNADKQTVDKLRSVKWFVDCGDDDFILDLSYEFHKAMSEKRLKHELRVRNGVHNWEYWHTALRLSLPFASRNFAK